MKARLNVLGRKLDVVSINYYKGEVTSVQVDCGENVYKTYREKGTSMFPGADVLLIDLKSALEFPELEERIVEGNNKLIKHLEEKLQVEDEKLINIAVDAMESDADSLPFTSFSLSNQQKEYKLTQQRVLGIIDAIEEVKAYTEGYYADKNNDESVETEEHHQPIE